jgi:hypothetical protein
VNLVEHLAQQRQPYAVEAAVEVVDDHRPGIECESSRERDALAHPGRY